MKETQQESFQEVMNVMKELEYTDMRASDQRSHFRSGNGMFWRLRERKKLARLRK